MADVELIALTIEARRRGLSYGQLVARTTEEERRKIVDKYRGGSQKKGNKGKINKGGPTVPALCGMVLCAASGIRRRRRGPYKPNFYI